MRSTFRTPAHPQNINSNSSGSGTPRLNEDTAWDGEWIDIGHGMAIEAKVSNFAADLVEMGFLVARVK